MTRSLSKTAALGSTFLPDGFEKEEVVLTVNGGWARTLANFGEDGTQRIRTLPVGGLQRDATGAPGGGSAGQGDSFDGRHAGDASAPGASGGADQGHGEPQLARVDAITSRTQTPGPRSKNGSDSGALSGLVHVDAKGNLLREKQATFDHGTLEGLMSRERTFTREDMHDRTIALWSQVNPGCMKSFMNNYFTTTNREHYPPASAVSAPLTKRPFHFKANDFTAFTESKAKMVQMQKKSNNA